MFTLKDQFKLSLSTLIEWYDAMLYIALIPYLMHHLLPNSDASQKKLIIIFLGFAAGNLVRPVGALLFGLWGDKWSKKSSYNASIMLMCLMTALIGIIPDYQTIGVYAPILLIGIRLIQGLCCGAQFSTLLSINDQYRISENRGVGFINGLCESISLLGHTFALLAAYLVSTLSVTPGFSGQGWRIPFIFSIFLAIWHWQWGRKIELPEDACDNYSLLNSFSILLKNQSGLLLRNIILSVCMASIFSVVVFYSVPYMTFSLHISYGNATLIGGVILWINIITTPLFGYLSDRYSRNKQLLLSSAIIIVLSIMAMMFSDNTNGLISIFMLLAFVTAMIRGATLPLFAKEFHKKCKCIGTNFSYTIGITIASFIPSLLACFSHKSILALAVIMVGVACLLLVTSCFIYEGNSHECIYNESV
ncbi:MFS transporter [Dongshaea marina]|uniref:MFS transporter n=1 Tax=Dongshaea marina TaxID=2047966 RepID=UPI00131EE359|nr:MFS transporter [Dongshaea marina]